MKKIFLFILILFSIFLIACSSKNDNISGNIVVENNQPITDSNNIEKTNAVKTFVISGENFKFLMDGKENPDLIVNEGDKIRIEFTSGQGFHDFVVDEFNAKTSRVNDGGSTSVEFIADKKGIFEYYCSVGEHRQTGMKGKLIVK